MDITLYGIPNCDTVKKARIWLAAHDIAHHFHDFKKAGLDMATVKAWQQHVEWELLINRKGTTWRALSDDRKAAVCDAQTALALMLEAPSVIKRPVLHHANQTYVGFTDAHYRTLFNK